MTPNQTKIGFTENSENGRKSLRLCGSDSIASTTERLLQTLGVDVTSGRESSDPSYDKTVDYYIDLLVK